MKNSLNKLRTSLIALALVGFIGCEKPDPHPENRDPIYEDLGKQLKSVESDLKAAEKQLDEFKDAVNKVKPQTGQIKFAQKRVYDTEAQISKLRQKRDFNTLEIQTRLEYVRKQYLAAFTAKKQWPDPNEAAEYKAQQSLERASRSWNAKERIEAAKAPPPKPAGHGEEHESGGHH